MSDSDLTEAEKRYLEDLRNLPASVHSRLLGWAFELIPSIGLFVYGLFAGRTPFLVLGFLSLLYFSLWRMHGQLRGFRLMKGLYAKLVPPEKRSDGPPNDSGGQ